MEEAAFEEATLVRGTLPMKLAGAELGREFVKLEVTNTEGRGAKASDPPRKRIMIARPSQCADCKYLIGAMACNVCEIGQLVVAVADRYEGSRWRDGVIRITYHSDGRRLKQKKL